MFLNKCAYCQSILRVNDETLNATRQNCPVCGKEIYLCANYEFETNENSFTSQEKSQIPNRDTPPKKNFLLQEISGTAVAVTLIVVLGIFIGGPVIYLVVENIREEKKQQEIRRIYENNQREMREIKWKMKAAKEEYEREMRKIDSYDSYDF